MHSHHVGGGNPHSVGADLGLNTRRQMPACRFDRTVGTSALIGEGGRLKKPGPGGEGPGFVRSKLAEAGIRIDEHVQPPMCQIEPAGYFGGR